MFRTMLLMAAFGGLLGGLLGGCGGGGGDNTDSAPTPVSSPVPAPSTMPAAPSTGIAKFAGAWSVCLQEANNRSSSEFLTIKKRSDSTGTFVVGSLEYPEPGCSGKLLAKTEIAGSLTIVGTKLIGTETVDKVNIVVGDRVEKQIFVVRVNGGLYKNMLHTGTSTDEPGARVDSEGYPDAIDPIGATKQAEGPAYL